MFSIYVHIPFCLKKCGYCDFYSIPVERSRVPHVEYLDAINRQLERDVREFDLADREIGSVYFGGGTPSLMPPEFFVSLIEELKKYFSLNLDIEISTEVNPATCNKGWFGDVRDAGVNRISIGAQSFQPRLLKLLGRIHSAQDAMSAIAEAEDSEFKSVSVDLMYAIADESMSELEDDLRTAMTFQPEHISAYQLTIEKATMDHGPWTMDRSLQQKVNSQWSIVNGQNTFEMLSEHDQLKQMRTVARVLTRSGWGRYEISNYARPGFECRHNLNYWDYGEYLGLGAGAASFIRDKGLGIRDKEFGTSGPWSMVPGPSIAFRLAQAADVSKYQNGSAGPQIEGIDARTAMGEFCFMGLRKMAGISEKDFEEKFGVSFDSIYKRQCDELIAKGLLENKGPIYRLTTKGLELSNQVFAELV